ncbi:MAG: 6-phosphogluconolactonase [Thermoanaerobaculia bacterium]|nr:6-phosphogluconolactonase [Thermoanaerobaculia bacterium]MBP9824517.1 6-phosphogluconolactonase [Thermoanaerobaculia bacterium]
MKPEILVAAPEELAAAFVDRLERQAAAAIAERGRFSLALTGGSAATALLPRLVCAAIDWRRTDVFWGDERAVPATDPESNFALAQRLLLGPAQVPVANLHRLPADLPDLEAAGVAGETEMLGCLGDPPRFDVLWLGVGTDGHVASLFPGHPLLHERRRFVAAVVDSPKPPPRRLTLTLPAIAAARCLVVTALGESKAAAVGAALGEAGSGLPLALALAAADQAWLLLDPDAALQLPPGHSDAGLQAAAARRSSRRSRRYFGG